MRFLLMVMTVNFYSCSEVNDSRPVKSPDRYEEGNTDVPSGLLDDSIGAPPEKFSSWDDIERVDPELFSDQILDGIDPLGDDCSVYLMGSTISSNDEVLLILRSSFRHNGEGHKLFLVPYPKQESKTSIGSNIEDPGQIAVFFGADNSFSSVSGVNIKWWHRDHFDTNRCINLKPRQSKEENMLLPEGLNSLEEIDHVDSESFHLKKFLGYDPVKRAFGEEDSCYLYLMVVDYQKEYETYYLRTSFNHGGVSHPSFSVEWSSQVAGQSEIELKLASDSDSFLLLKHLGTIESSKDLTIKWRHVDHFHVDQCQNLMIQ